MKRKMLKIFREAIKPFLRRGIGRFYPAKLGYKFFVAFFNPIEIQGSKMFVEPTDGLELLIKPTHEEIVTELFKKEVQSGDTVLDLGAHIGYYTLIAAKLTGKTGRVFAFEPDPTSFALLKKNTEINGYKNVTLVQKAISNKTGKGKLYLQEKRAQNRIYDSNENNPFIEIETIKLDDYIKEKVDFIKMDIEGNEGMAAQGMLSILKKNHPMKIITEFYPSLIRKSGVEPIEFLKILKECGFSLHKINSEEKRLEPINEFEQISNIEGYISLFCAK